MRYAYTSKRVGATLIDYTLFFALVIFYIVMVGTRDEEGVYRVTGIPALILFLFWFLYFVITEQYMDGTLGHQIFKLRVISRDGQPVTLGQTIIRRVCDALEISWCFGSIAFLLVKSTDQNQRLGDLLAKTRVIGKKDTAEEIKFEFEEV
ncbi:RDD family protein [Flavitalea flava]